MLNTTAVSLTCFTKIFYVMTSESDSFLPGFELSEEHIAGRLDFDTIRLASDDRFDRGDRTDGEWKLSDAAREAAITIINNYYERRPAIEEEVHIGAKRFAFRVLSEDVKIVSQLLAVELEIRFEVSDFIPSNPEEEPDSLEYTDVIGDIVTVPDASWGDLPETEFDVEEAFTAEIPDGHTNPDFSHDDYLDYMNGHLVPAIQEAGWKGGHAWLLNLGMQELRNGHYEEAAYAFEGAKDGLIKHSLFGESRIQLPVKRALNTLRDLCLLKAPDEYDFGGFDLYWRANMRDLIYVPEFTARPSLDDPYFRMTNQLWVANALVLIQGIAHAIGGPTISRAEIDPFGSGMSIRNTSFVLKLADKLVSSVNEESASEPIQYLDEIDFGSFTPDVTITRTLRSAGYTIRMYGKAPKSVHKRLGIEFDFIAERDDDVYLVRAMRPEDRDIKTVRDLSEELREREDIEHSILFLYDRELNRPGTGGFINQDGIKLAYIDLQSERLSPLSSGYPRGFADFTTEEEIREEISRRYEAAKETESSNAKGNRLEDLMEFIFDKAVPDTETMTRNNRISTGEIDLQLQNDEMNHPWTQLGAPINVECKNLKDPANVDIIYSVYGKAEVTSSDSKGAILVSWEGISDSRSGRNTDGLLSKLRGSDLDILTIDKNDLAEIAETGDAQVVFERAYTELYQR